jgi:hypothetical protein
MQIADSRRELLLWQKKNKVFSVLPRTEITEIGDGHLPDGIQFLAMQAIYRLEKHLFLPLVLLLIFTGTPGRLNAQTHSDSGTTNSTEAPSISVPVLQIKADQVTAHVSPTLYGLMTEEINYSYEGGLYG